MSKTPPLQAVIFGCGRIAGGFDQDRQAADDNIFSHAGAYRRHDGFEIAACVEPDDAKRKAFMAYWGIAEGYANLREWIKSAPAHDVASICAPTAQHADILDALLPTGVRGVLAEKPGGTDPARLKKTAAAYRRAEKPLLVNYTRRFDPAMAELRQRISAGDTGKIRSVAVFYNKGVRNNASHAIDLVSWLLSSPLSILSVAQCRVDHDENDPTVNAVLSANGVPTHMIGGDARDYSLFEIYVVAERETIEIKDLGFTVRRRTVIESPHFQSYNELGPTREYGTHYGQAMLHAINQLYDAVRNGHEPVSSGESAAATLALAEAVLNQAKASLS